VKAVADTLGVARSNLAERARTRPGPRQPCRKAGDAEFLPVLRRLVDERPTYGYRRLTALLNRERQVGGEPPVNRERVLRILRADGLTLQAHTARRPGRAHDGVVVALRSDVRWCSDHFEIAGRDGGVVRVLFAIDACDREVIAWQATTAGVSGEMVRDLMVECVERRFGATRTAHPVEWLSDNGSGYRAKETLDTATALGLRPAFTPARSPESNGLAEAFVKTLKRDYARVTLLPDAPTILRLVSGWIEDYNTSHPHGGLRMLSPREFRTRCA
jgi:transposase InsO family protein